MLLISHQLSTEFTSHICSKIGPVNCINMSALLTLFGKNQKGKAPKTIPYLLVSMCNKNSFDIAIAQQAAPRQADFMTAGKMTFIFCTR